jgi:hypothetical protein
MSDDQGTRRTGTGISRAEAMADRKYEVADDIQHLALVTLPITLVVGFLVADVVGTYRAFVVYVCAAFMHGVVSLVCEVVKVWVFMSNLAEQRRNMSGPPLGPGRPRGG